MQLAYIYVLRDPRNDEICYVGSTIDPQQRATQHWCGASSVKMRGWVEELAELGMRHTLEVIESWPFETRRSREKHWIQLFRQYQYPLINTHYNH